MYRHSISTRLLLLFFALVLPLLLVGTYILFQNLNVLQTSIHETIYSGLLEQQRSMESRILGVQQDLQTLIEEDKDAREFLIYYNTYDAATYWRKVGNIKSALQRIKRSEDLLDNVTVYYPMLKKQISTKWGISPFDDTEYQQHLDAIVKQNWGLVDEGEHFFVGYSFPVFTAYQDPRILLVATLSNASLRRTLREGSYTNSPVALINSDTESVFFTENYIADFSNSDQKTILLEETRYRVFSTDSSLLNCSITRLVPESILTQNNRQVLTLMACYLLLAVCVAFCYIVSVRKQVSKPIHTLIHSLERMQLGELDFQIPNDKSNHEFGTLIQGFNEMLSRLDRQIQTTYKMEIYTRTLELKHLQSQINPHFLYNTLYMLRHMILDEDYDNASSLATFLGGYFRYVYESNTHDITLEHEFNHARNYLSIQCMRFRGQLRTDIQPLPDELKNMVVPALILQPLYENSILYAMQGDESPLCIQTSFDYDKKNLRIVVSDDGHSLTPETFQLLSQHVYSDEADEKPTALSNIRKRLSLRYGSSYGMKLSQPNAHGLCIEILIPLQPKDSEEDS